MTAMHQNRYAPPVYQLEDQRQFAQQPVRTPAGTWGGVNLGEVLALADELTAAGYDAGHGIAKIRETAAAIDAALTRDDGKHLTGDLDTMTPEAVAEALRRTALDNVARVEMGNIHSDYQTRLAGSAAKNLRAVADTIVTRMRDTFDPAAAAVQTAADKGLTSGSDVTVLLETAPPDVIDAYRNLADAVTELNRITELRNKMTSIGGVGPAEFPICAILATATTLEHIEGAQNVWQGTSEAVTYTAPLTGSHAARRRIPRLGGSWLALITSGYRLRLNTGTEATAVLMAATIGSRAAFEASEPA